MYKKIMDDLKKLKDNGVKSLKIVPYIVLCTDIWGNTSLCEVGCLNTKNKSNRDLDNSIKVINSAIGGKASYTLEYDDDDEVVGIEIVCTPRIPKLKKVDSKYTEMEGDGNGTKTTENDAK